MKLPTDIHLSGKANTSSATPSSGGTSAASAPQTQALPRAIQTLIHTWAKVESSHALSPKQNQQVQSQLSLLTGAPASAPTTKTSGVSERLNLSQLAKTITSEQPLPPKLTLALVKLITVNGPMSILSERPLAKATDVFLTQSTDGKLQIQTPKLAPVLEQFRNQFIGRHFTPSPISLIDNRQALSAQTPSVMPPSTTLQASMPLAPKMIQQAIQYSGQNLEAILQSRLQPQAPATVNTAQQTTAQSSEASISPRLQQVEQHIQKWVAQFQQTFKKPVPTPTDKPAAQPQATAPSASASASATSTFTKGIDPNNNPLLQLHTTTPTLNTAAPSQPATTSLDQKAWLLQSQQQLMETLKSYIHERKDQVIPNWSSIQTQSSGIKTFQDLSQWLTLLMLPKTHTATEQPVWPKNLSVQPQLQQTLLNLFNSLTKDGAAKEELQLLRQLLNINQSLTKVTHDQIQNRIWQGQSDITQFQLSLPYVHQQHVHWCDLECQQQTETNTATEKVNGWHLILRFAQDTPQAFAIESYLKQSQVTLTLWASEAEQLKRLHTNIPLIKHKLEKAGFNVEQVSSKHGQPKPLHQPIQQSLIDVHT